MTGRVEVGGSATGSIRRGSRASCRFAVCQADGMRGSLLLLWVAMSVVLSGCAAAGPGQRAYEFRGDEIVVAGQLFHTGAPVVLWLHRDGYDAYRVERRFAAFDESAWEASSEGLETPNRYGLRHRGNWPAPILEDIRGGGWDLPLLQRTVDQFVVHYDASGTSARCFETLHDHRGLSVHFLLDVDGTIYQTLDLKERAWHAGVANDRSIGIEIANVGAYPVDGDTPFERWYGSDEHGRTIVTPPPGTRPPHGVARPVRSQAIVGDVNGRRLVQYDLTPQQYESLAKLTAALVRIFPRLPLDVPRDEQGNVRTDRPLTEAELAGFRGVLGHHHVTGNKVDPGPAFQWDYLLDRTRWHLKRTADDEAGDR